MARDLIGAFVIRDDVVLRITETEAYTGPDDTACHARSGKTARNASIFAKPGTVYVYLCYGIHHLLNVATDAEGIGAAVLIRACEPYAGEPTIRARRGNKRGPELTAGPGRVGQALGLDISWCFHDACDAGGLEFRTGSLPKQLLAGPRVGIDYAEDRDRLAPLRFADGQSTYVTAKKALHPLNDI